MKQAMPDKSSVAWFKLAEFVSRGEKERALSIYRLLSYSISNPALVAQLEGDILYAFHDERALESYRRAIDIYSSENSSINVLDLSCQMISLLVDRQRITEINDLISFSRLSISGKARLHEHTTLEMLKREDPELRKHAIGHLKTLITEFNKELPLDAHITAFLATLAAIDKEAHQYACALIAADEEEPRKAGTKKAAL